MIRKMEFKETATITVEKGNKKKVKCYKFQCKPIKRQLMVHEDIDKKGHSTVSDVVTGYRLFALPITPNKITPSDIKEELKRFITHYTKEGIATEFRRIEGILGLESSK